MNIIILGGGASGLMLASILKKNHVQADIEIIEKYEHVGKKLLLTGNGRCNLTNTKITKKCYNLLKGYEIASSFNTKEYFESLGLMTTTDNEGRVYPLSMVSNSVLDILRESIEGVTIHSSTTIIRITKKENKFHLTSDKNKIFKADILIMATGGRTYYKDSNSYILASMLSHRIVPLRPTLTALKVQENLTSIENIRCKVKAKLLFNHQVIYEDVGEVLFKKDALSGIVIFQLSSIIARDYYQKYKIELDLLPSMTLKQIVEYLTLHPRMTGLFPKMINQYIMKQSGNLDLNNLAYTIKHLTFHVVENMDYKNAQVTAGGVAMDELSNNLESTIHPNLYFAGEMLDVDGICGGYNLQFAFASADKIALSILEKLGEKNEKNMGHSICE